MARLVGMMLLFCFARPVQSAPAALGLTLVDATLPIHVADKPAGLKVALLDDQGRPCSLNGFEVVLNSSDPRGSVNGLQVVLENGSAHLVDAVQFFTPGVHEITATSKDGSVKGKVGGIEVKPLEANIAFEGETPNPMPGLVRTGSAFKFKYKVTSRGAPLSNKEVRIKASRGASMTPERLYTDANGFCECILFVPDLCHPAEFLGDNPLSLECFIDANGDHVFNGANIEPGLGLGPIGIASPCTIDLLLCSKLLLQILLSGGIVAPPPPGPGPIVTTSGTTNRPTATRPPKNEKARLQAALDFLDRDLLSYIDSGQWNGRFTQVVQRIDQLARFLGNLPSVAAIVLKLRCAAELIRHNPDVKAVRLSITDDKNNGKVPISFSESVQIGLFGPKNQPLTQASFSICTAPYLQEVQAIGDGTTAAPTGFGLSYGYSCTGPKPVKVTTTLLFKSAHVIIMDPPEPPVVAARTASAAFSGIGDIVTPIQPFPLYTTFHIKQTKDCLVTSVRIRALVGRSPQGLIPRVPPQEQEVLSGLPGTWEAFQRENPNDERTFGRFRGFIIPLEKDPGTIGPGQPIPPSMELRDEFKKAEDLNIPNGKPVTLENFSEYDFQNTPRAQLSGELKEALKTLEADLSRDLRKDESDTRQGVPLRMFPDAENPIDDVVHDVIAVEARVATPEPDAQIVFQVFDIDDPTAGGPGFIDDERDENDNRPIGVPEGFFIDPDSGRTSVRRMTRPVAGGRAVVFFQVAHRPGNNYKFAATCVRHVDELDRTLNIDNRNDGLKLGRYQGVGRPGMFRDKYWHNDMLDPVKVTQALSVWRKLYVEAHSMRPETIVNGPVTETVGDLSRGTRSAPDDNGFEVQLKAVKAEALAGGKQQIWFQRQDVRNGNVLLAQAFPFEIHTTDGTDQWKGGLLRTTDRETVLNYDIESSKAVQNIPGTGSVIELIVVPRAGNPAIVPGSLFDKLEAFEDEFKADGNQLPRVRTHGLPLDFTNAADRNRLFGHMQDTELTFERIFKRATENVFQRAYIVPKSVPLSSFSQVVPPIAHVESANQLQAFRQNTNESVLFWIVHVFAVYEIRKSADNDGTEPALTNPLAEAESIPNEGGLERDIAWVPFELLFDYIQSPPGGRATGHTFETILPFATMHEIGHQFGLSHEHSRFEFDLMSGAVPSQYMLFSELNIGRLRSQRSSPGYEENH